MKRELAIILALSALFLIAGTQTAAAQAGKEEVSNPDGTTDEYTRMSTPYLEKGLLYLGIAGLLIAILLLFHYKV